MMHFSSGRTAASSRSAAEAPSEHRAKSAPAPETLMSYELVRHQVQRRLHVEKISTDAIQVAAYS
jgi:hypothetical protein